MNANVLAALAQLAPLVERVTDTLGFLFVSPIARQPYALGVAADPGQVIAAGVRNQVLNVVDFSHSLEYPFEVRRIRFSNDPAHTFRDWRVLIKDLTFAQDWMKNPLMVDTLITPLTGAWELEFPWVIRPQGGGLQIYVDNLDAANPITVNVTLEGRQLIPQSRIKNGVNA
jgi:hypothetical protein